MTGPQGPNDNTIMNRSVKITVLNDNRPSGILASEHGLSWLIETDGGRVLFDTGPSDVFLRNARKMEVDLDGIDTIVLSHGHYDHGNGLVYLERKEGEKRTLICHPEAFAGKYRKGDHGYIGLPLSREEAEEGFDLILTTEPYHVTENILFLGEIPRTNDFESKKTSFEKEDGTEDFMADDSGVAVITSKGLIVITGCGHAGICNTLSHAVKVTGEKRIVAAMGGFHLKYDDNQTQGVVECFIRMGVEKAFPSHCTELPALARFYAHYRNGFVRSGDVFRFER